MTEVRFATKVGGTSSHIKTDVDKEIIDLAKEVVSGICTHRREIYMLLLAGYSLAMITLICKKKGFI